jgi:UDP-glucose 4-epimerase
MDTCLEGKRVLITGGTGSLGKILTKTILSGVYGKPAKVIIFSRDEAKQYDMRLAFRHLGAATEEIIYEDAESLLHFRLGDVRDFQSISSVLREADVVFNAAALKQVPTCEYFPYDAVRTNIEGPENIVTAIRQLQLPVEVVMGISTDKACKPINVMGMSKAIQERIFINGNLYCDQTRFTCVRYGNVLASRGSVIPLFHNQIKSGGPVTITTKDMTRFLLPLSSAVNTVMAAYMHGRPGEVFIPRILSSRILTIVEALIGDRGIEVKEIGIRPGEKIHEILVSEDEVYRTVARNGHYVVQPILPEIGAELPDKPALTGEYSSANELMTLEQARKILGDNGLLMDDLKTQGVGEVLR